MRFKVPNYKVLFNRPMLYTYTLHILHQHTQVLRDSKLTLTYYHSTTCYGHQNLRKVIQNFISVVVVCAAHKPQTLDFSSYFLCAKTARPEERKTKNKKNVSYARAQLYQHNTYVLSKASQRMFSFG